MSAANEKDEELIDDDATDNQPEEELAMEDDPHQDNEQPVAYKKRPGPFMRFIRSAFSHVVFAAIIFGVAGYLGYLNNGKIMRDVGDTVCATNMLGGYMSKPGSAGTQVASNESNAAHSAESAPTNSAATGGASNEASTSTAPVQLPNDLPAGRTPMSEQIATTKPAPTPARSMVAVPAPQVSATPKSIVTSAPTSPAKLPAQPPPTNTEHATPDTQPTQPDQQSAEAVTTPAAATAKEHKPADQETSVPTPAAAQETAMPREPAQNQNAPPSTPPQKLASIPQQPQQQTAVTPTAPASSQDSQTSQSPQTDPVQAPAKPLDQASLRDALDKVRQAYAKGQPGTDRAYKQLIKQFPDVPDLPGELGNIYYQQGKLSAAAEQYYEAAMRLIQLKQPGRAACLLGVLNRIDPRKADALRQQTNQRCVR